MTTIGEIERRHPYEIPIFRLNTHVISQTGFFYETSLKGPAFCDNMILCLLLDLCTYRQKRQGGQDDITTIGGCREQGA